MRMKAFTLQKLAKGKSRIFIKDKTFKDIFE